MSKCNLYRVIYLRDMGYVVYRHCFDDRKCSIEDGARVHKTAIFVAETEANHYVAYRNRLTARRGTDALQ